MLIKCNKSDWSGEEIEVKVNDKNNSFELYGETYMLDFLIYDFNESEKDEFCNVYRLDKYGNKKERVINCGFTYGDGTWEFEAYGISRTDKNPYIAVIQVLCNIA